MVFSFSMAASLVSITRLFVNPTVVIEKKFAKDEIENYILKIEGVRYADRCNISYGILETRENFKTVMLKQVDASYFNKEREDLLAISVEDLGEKDIIISSALARDLGVKKNDRLAFVDANTKRAKMYNIAYIYDTGLSDFDNNTAFCLLSDDNYNKLELVTHDRERAELFTNFGKKINNKKIYDSLCSYADPMQIRYSSEDSILNIISSINSIRFILYLFVLLSAFYSYAVIKNVNNRSVRIVKIYEVLGCNKIFIYKLLSLIILILLSSFVGMILALVFSYILPKVLIFINSFTSLNLDYYLLSFKIYVPYRSIVIYNLIIIFFSLIDIFVLHLISKKRFYLK